MTGPKHLWSGNWQDESRAREPAPAAPRTPDPDDAAAQTPTRTRRPTPSRRPIWLALAVVVIVVGLVYGLTRHGSSDRPQAPAVALGPSTTPNAVPPGATNTTTTTPTPTLASQPIRWLGMEILTVPPGAAAIDTVALGSQGDRAGLEPGDIILSVNHRSVTSSTDIAVAIRGLTAGDAVPIQISRGSGTYTTEATLAAPPTKYP